MSLDVYLESEPKEKEVKCYCCGSTRIELVPETYYERNITHNLGKMAQMAGIYQHLWRPEEIGITKASQLIDPLQKAYVELGSRDDYYKQFNPPNGWGNYENLVDFVYEYLQACKQNPDALIHISR